MENLDSGVARNSAPVNRLLCAVLSLSLLAAAKAFASPEALLSAIHGKGDFALAQPGVPTEIYVESACDAAVKRAAADLADDIERVTGRRPLLVTTPSATGSHLVIIGELGKTPIVDRLSKTGKIDAGGMSGRWECSVVQVVDTPMAGVDRAMVIAGSDRRGAIYGIYDVSEAIGVSPWYWWADVPVQRRSELWISPGPHRRETPAVRYRGIFLNDEDWGLRPWASRTFDPQTGNIGPKTYAKVFELLLRLRANCLWPAMHPGTRAFNTYPENKVLADRFGIVMGSSHAEPMLRDNVDEWDHDVRGGYDYSVNRQGVLRYWEERVRQNAPFENIYTVGMRGIHDGPMAGGGDRAARSARLGRIIADQREVLARLVRPDLGRIPQMFCPYKEVLPVYRYSPRIVPDDITLVWPDDNYGYIQHFSNGYEQGRSGGAGVYYHVSYWGRPYDYLWLCSTPPALIGEEMTKAYEYGARRIWMLNVGDLKPAEIDIEFFMRLAWDPGTWRPEDGQNAFLRRMAERDFGATTSGEIAGILDEYYRLNFQRRPEHMGIDPTNPLLASPSFADTAPFGESGRRLDAFAALSARANALAARLSAAQRDAFYELVQYPVLCSDLMNQKGINWGRYYQAAATPDERARYLALARSAQNAIEKETALYNGSVAGGKWRGIMSDAPRKLHVFDNPGGSPLPGAAATSAGTRETAADGRTEIDVARTSSRTPREGSSWRSIGGLGYNGHSLTVIPSAVSKPMGADEIQARSPSLAYSVTIAASGDWDVVLRCLPTWSVGAGGGRRYAVSFDDQPLQIVSPQAYGDENDPHWQEDVLRNAAYTLSRQYVDRGRHTLRIWSVDPEVVIDGILIAPMGYAGSSYSWPAEADVVRQNGRPQVVAP
jgi:hypothetical protein